MSITEHAILHRRNKSRYKGNVKETEPTVTYIPHIFVSQISQSYVNRDNFGTRIDGDIKVLIWDEQALEVQDQVELNGDINDIGKGDMYEMTKIVKNLLRTRNVIIYILKRLQ